MRLVMKTAERHLDLLPADIRLAPAAANLHVRNFRESVLRKALAPEADRYEYIILDCQPTLDVLAINASSAALMLSGIPFDGPIGAVRVAFTTEGAWIPHPTFEEGEESTFELVVAGRARPSRPARYGDDGCDGSGGGRDLGPGWFPGGDEDGDEPPDQRHDRDHGHDGQLPRG